MKRGRGIAFRLSLLIVVGGGFAVAMALAYNYILARRLIVAEVEGRAQNLAAATANHVEAVLRATQKPPDLLADLMEESTYGEAQLWKLLLAEIEQNPEIYGSTIAFEPYAFDDGRRYFAPYFYRREPGQIEFTNLGGENYRYFYLDWYELPKELGHSVWSEPYYDEGGGNILMATYSVPFYRTVSGERRFTGVVTADISLNWLRGYLSSLQMSDTGYAFLISKNGRMVAHPRADFVMNETIFTLAEAYDDPHLRSVGRDMIRGNQGLTQTRSLVTGKVAWLVYAPVPSTGWSLAVVVPQDEMLAGVWNLTRIQFLLAAAGGLLFLAIVIGVARSITRPLTALAQASEEMARGNLDGTLPAIKRNDEVGSLTQAFAHMQRDLKQYLREHDQLAAIRHELDVARRIQQSILPRAFPPFPDRHDFEIFADMLPAQEVGGDFYDLFLVDDDRLAFAIADVSGKGVPAAIFMAVTRTILRSVALQGVAPGECLRRVNSLLCLENSADMFVSLFYGVLDTRSGALDYCNGGHLNPYLLRATGPVEQLAGTGGVVLGAVEGGNYFSQTTSLHRGDGVFLYTDGVTEAVDAAGQFFSDHRLHDCLVRINGSSPEDIVRRVVDSVQHYAGPVPQNDDITALAVRYSRQ
jgi:sigma-B regulation protein RsbU (phosphoserine phosphatase)